MIRCYQRAPNAPSVKFYAYRFPLKMLSQMLTPCMSNASKVLNSMRFLSLFSLRRGFFRIISVPPNPQTQKLTFQNRHSSLSHQILKQILILIFFSVPPDPQGPDIDAQSCSLVYQASRPFMKDHSQINQIIFWKSVIEYKDITGFQIYTRRISIKDFTQPLA